MLSCFCRTSASKGKCDALNGSGYSHVTQATVDAAKKACCGCPNNHVTTISAVQNEPATLSTPASSTHPVAAIMPGITNPVAYHTANDTIVLNGSDNSDNEVSVHQPKFVGAFIESIKSVANTPPSAWIS